MSGSQCPDQVGVWRMTLAWWSHCCTLTGCLPRTRLCKDKFPSIQHMSFFCLRDMQRQSKPFTSHSVPLWLKMPSISMEDLEWAMQSIEQGTRPSWAGERSVVLTRHQSGFSWQRSSTSTVWPRRTASSLLLLAMKSCMTTVSSQPPESWGRKDFHVLSVGHWAYTFLLTAENVASYLIAVQCVLGCAGRKWNGVRLAASFTLTVQILPIPARHSKGVEKC